MKIAGSISFPAQGQALGLLLILFLAMGVSGAAAAQDPVSFRARLRVPDAVRALPSEGVLAWAVSECGELSDALGVRVSPTVPPGTVRAIQERLFRARRSVAGADEGLAVELARWVEFDLRPDGIARGLLTVEDSRAFDLVEPVVLPEVTGTAPDDPLFSNQRPWADLVGMTDAWDAVLAEGGAPAVVAIVDGGFEWDHEDLEANLFVHPDEIDGDGIDQDGNGFVDDILGWNFTLGTPDPRPLPDQPANGRHGTHVAGIIGAVMGNGLGIAGAGANPRIVLVNAAHPTIDTAIRYGYEGILYAVGRGADIVNCSWRTVLRINGVLKDPPWFEYEALVLAIARQSGVLVVAASGNDQSTDLWATPAGYPDALGVGATRFNLAEPWPFGNTGDWLDFMAPGETIMSTFPVADSGRLGPYGILSGTSMACAVTSGVAALLKAVHPDWKAEELRGRLGWTTRPMDTGGRLGLLQADRALLDPPSPAVTLDYLGFADENGDGLVEGSEEVELRFRTRALFAPVSNVEIEVQTDDPWLVPLIDRLRLAVVDVNNELVVERGLKLWVHPGAPAGHVASLRMRASVADQSGPWQFVTLELRPIGAVLAGSRIQVSASANGAFGDSSPLMSRARGNPAVARGDGRAFGWAAGLVVSSTGGVVSDALLPFSPLSPYKDFFPFQGGIERIEENNGVSELRLGFSDRAAPQTLGLRVEQRLRLADLPGLDDFVVVEYTFTAGERDLPGLRWGLVADWALPAASGPGSVDHRVEGAPELQTLFVEPAAGTASDGIVGMRILSAAEGVGVDAIAVWATEDEPGWNQPGRFTETIPDSTLQDRMQPGLGPGLGVEGDRVGILSAELGTLAMGESRRVALAIALAPDREGLDDALERARQAWEAEALGLVPGNVPSGILRLSRNPFRTDTTMSFRVSRPGVARAEVFDLRGRRVATLLQEPVSAGIHHVVWDATDGRGRRVASGVYLLRLHTVDGVESRPVSVVR